MEDGMQIREKLSHPESNLLVNHLKRLHLLYLPLLFICSVKVLQCIKIDVQVLQSWHYLKQASIKVAYAVSALCNLRNLSKAATDVLRGVAKIEQETAN